MLKRLACFLVVGGLVLAGCRSTGTIESSVGLNPTQDDSRISFSMHVPEGSGPFPAVILMHGCTGLGPWVEAGMSLHVSRLVDAGFIALILDSFTVRRIDHSCTGATGSGEATFFRQYDAFHALRHLQEQDNVDPDNIFLMGQSQGGSVAALLAGAPLGSLVKGSLRIEYPSQTWFRAIVAYYPWCPHVPKWLDTPLLVLSGDLDKWTPPKDCVWHKAVVKGAPYEVVVYEDAHHSFDLPFPPVTNDFGYIVGGNFTAATDSRRRMVNWFLEHME